MEEKLKIFQVDAFASELFRGNPAAVVPLEQWLPDENMQAIAAENNLSETAFFVPAPGDDVDYHLRWFTPKVEVELCGHATLASAHVLHNHLGAVGDCMSFSSRSGRLVVRFEDDLIVLDFPAVPCKELSMTSEISLALRSEPRELYHGQDDNLMAVYDTAAQVQKLAPDFNALVVVYRGCLIATAPGEDVDFVSRFFAPGAGIDEDPVTGSSHCLMTPYWAEKLGKRRLRARQISRRGGELRCTLQGNRVHIAGRAVTFLEGTILLSAVKQAAAAIKAKR